MLIFGEVRLIRTVHEDSRNTSLRSYTNMASGWMLVFVVAVHATLAAICTADQTYQKQICSFYGESRKPKEEYSLSNCTWYKDRSCCGRTEVTSVFQEMMPIDSSSADCYNHMNYLMCYFCSPDQYKWYRDGKLHVCKEFCQDVYDHCKDAKNGGKKISSMYSSGKAFCEAQAFLVVDNNENCFEFDSTHFDAGTRLMPFINLIFGVVSILLLL